MSRHVLIHRDGSEEKVRPLRCHRCRSTALALTEVYHEHARYDEGLYLAADGTIGAVEGAVLSPGDLLPHLTQIECADCGHSWHPRRTFTGVA